jgi:hypothetical protein
MQEHRVHETRTSLLIRYAELQSQLDRTKKRLHQAASQLLDMASEATTTDPTDSKGTLSRSIKELDINRFIADVKSAERELVSAQIDVDKLDQP